MKTRIDDENSLKQENERLCEIVSLHEERHHISCEAHKTVVVALKKKIQQLSETVALNMKAQIKAKDTFVKLKAANQTLIQENGDFLEQIQRMTAEKCQKMKEIREQYEMLILELETDLKE